MFEPVNLAGFSDLTRPLRVISIQIRIPMITTALSLDVCLVNPLIILTTNFYPVVTQYLTQFISELFLFAVKSNTHTYIYLYIIMQYNQWPSLQVTHYYWPKFTFFGPLPDLIAGNFWKTLSHLLGVKTIAWTINSTLSQSITQLWQNHTCASRITQKFLEIPWNSPTRRESSRNVSLDGRPCFACEPQRLPACTEARGEEKTQTVSIAENPQNMDIVLHMEVDR
jgi:hypothetical protein